MSCKSFSTKGLRLKLVPFVSSDRMCDNDVMLNREWIAGRIRPDRFKSSRPDLMKREAQRP